MDPGSRLKEGMKSKNRKLVTSESDGLFNCDPHAWRYYHLIGGSLSEATRVGRDARRHIELIEKPDITYLPKRWSRQAASCSQVWRCVPQHPQ